jgi:hypothetical protein
VYPPVTQLETVRLEAERELQLIRERRPRLERAPRTRRPRLPVLARLFRRGLAATS